MKIFSEADYKHIITKLVREGNEVGETFEFIGETIELPPNSVRYILQGLCLDSEITDAFVEAICKFETKQVGPFSTDKYIFLVPAVKSAVAQIKEDCNETRRAVIQFPKEHCFQSIQFLLRDNTIHIVCSMRSCNAVKNLPYDIWLCYFLADMFSHYLHETTGIRPYPTYKLKMLIGSLHVFKKDVK